MIGRLKHDGTNRPVIDRLLSLPVGGGASRSTPRASAAAVWGSAVVSLVAAAPRATFAPRGGPGVLSLQARIRSDDSARGWLRQALSRRARSTARRSFGSGAVGTCGVFGVSDACSVFRRARRARGVVCAARDSTEGGGRTSSFIRSAASICPARSSPSARSFSRRSCASSCASRASRAPTCGERDGTFFPPAACPPP